MSFNKTKFDVMRSEASKSRREKLSKLGEIVVVPYGSEPRKLSCEKHGEYETVLADRIVGATALRNAIHGGKPTEMNESTYCPACINDLDEEFMAEDKRISALEDADREEKFYRHRIALSGVPPRHSFFTLDEITAVNAKQEKALEIAKEMIAMAKKGNAAPNLIMTGAVGTGKSLIAAATIQSAIRANLRAEISTVMNVIRDFRATWKKDCDYTESQFIKKLTTVDVLALDEVGVQYGSDSEKLFIFDVIDGRYRNMLPTILISNLNLDGIRECVGERCVDRMREDGGKVVTFDFESQRGKV